MTAPTLLVGLGGSGSKIIQRVYNLATPAQRANLSFVIFDTDINELRDIREKTPAIKTVQTSAKLTVGEYLDADRYSRDTWFPVNKILSRKALTEGAGQVRSISRLALNTTIQQGRMLPLEEAITNLYVMSGDKSNQAMRVMIVGSLCGGTGSGLILPVSLYIRNYLKTRLQQGSAVIRGFFILPEVFYHVIPTIPERNNLKCNAYAAVREIDAFLMKGDGSLPENYDLKFMVPRTGSNQQDDIADSPMDFCFLFDAQNIDGQQLTNYNDYIDHAANCIYAQSIAPTSKRSNSSEDNVIGEVVQAGGRNRFCGAGSALLEYPEKDVEDYLTLIWARDNISSEWLDLDRKFKKSQKDYIKQKRLGYNVAPIKRHEQYVQDADLGYKNHQSFLSSITNMCYGFSTDGFVRNKEGYWVDYINEVNKYIKENIEELKERTVNDTIDVLEAAKAEVEGASGGDLANKFESWYVSLEEFREATKNYTKTLAENLAYTLFKDETDFTRTEESYRIEYWLRQNENNIFDHPNAARYFLCQVLMMLEKEAKLFRGKRTKDANGMSDGGAGDTVEGINEFWEEFETMAFDDPSTERKKETSDDFYKSSYMTSRGLTSFFHRSTIETKKNHLLALMTEYGEKTEAYWETYVKCIVYETAVKYYREMLNAFDAFYDVLERKVDALDKNILDIEEKYHIGGADEKDGKTVRYVCCDEQCLNAINNEVINLGSSIDVPDELSRGIFAKVRKFAMADAKPKSEKYFSETYENTILGYYKKSILDSYESVVHMDVLTALAYECRVKGEDMDMSDAAVEIYSSHVIDNVRHRARPFIESPMGREPRIIEACTYSKELAETDVPGRKRFVSKNLLDHGGVADEDIDPSRIVFYQGVYGLRANELSKFAPPKKAETYNRPSGGEYYNAYYERVNGVHPEPRRTRSINPHIDRWWHVITKLPDLDEENQTQQEYNIDAAFFWGMLGGTISYGQEDLKKKVYKINVDEFENLTGDDEDLVVSNGTPCDNFYEVLDAITIFPMIVSSILGKRDRIIEGELNSQIPVSKSFMFNALNKFRVSEFIVDADGTGEDELGTLRSIFEIPLLMKRSVPAEDYYEESMMRLLITILNEVKSYISRFCSKIEYQKTYAQLLKDQYELMIKNVEVENGLRGNTYQDSLFVRICNMISRELDEQYQYDYAEEIRSLLKHKASEV